MFTKAKQLGAVISSRIVLQCGICLIGAKSIPILTLDIGMN